MKFDLFILTSKRLSLFKETINSFFTVNPNVNPHVNKVFILDDRSNWGDREEMVNYITSYISGNPTMICFNDNKPFAWVDKFNLVGKIAESEFVFLLEDDWKCVEPIIFDELFNEMTTTDITQIALCDPLWVQNDNIIEQNINGNYWDNPYPGDFKHITHKIDGVWGWTIVTMKHYTNNPALTKTNVFKENTFPKEKSFEAVFAERQKNPKQKFSKKLHFEHLGYEKSLINNHE